MNNIIQDIEKSQIEGKSVPDFRSGDTVKVSVKVKVIQAIALRAPSIIRSSLGSCQSSSSFE